MRSVYLKAENLSKSYPGGWWRGERRVLIDVSLEITKGESVGIVGASGAGKTTLGKILSGIETPDSGKVLFQGKELTRLSRREWGSFRRRVQILFQDPEGALDPSKKTRTLFHEVCNLVGMDEAARRERVPEILEAVGLSPEVLDRYPRQLSGGQNQRVVLGRILLLEPELIVLDEPTSSLDVSIQAQILHLLKELQTRKGLAYLFISHDHDVIRFMCDRVALLEEGALSDYDGGRRPPTTDSHTR